MNKDRLLLCGDVHAEFSTFGHLCKRYGHENAYIIQVGDWGMGFCKPAYYQTELTKLNNILVGSNCHLYAIRGNHDDPAYFRETNNPFDLSNITLLKDYSELELLGKKILCVGGAISVDRQSRIKKDKERKKYNSEALSSWWADEKVKILSPEEFQYGKYDIVVTHTRPGVCGGFKGSAYINELIGADPSLQVELIEEAAEMTKLWEYTKPELWAYGHFHMSMSSTHENTFFRCLDIDEHKLYDK